VLRPCYTLGAPGSGTLATFLRGPRVPRVLGYDPLFHFMHEDDLVAAIRLTLEKRIRGIFNVAGPQPVPMSLMIDETGRSAVPLPEPVLRLLVGRAGFPQLPKGAIDHLKFPIVVDSSAFRKATGFHHQFDELRTLRIYREAAVAPGLAR
jgi:UDP-glucose 4-epimerase